MHRNYFPSLSSAFYVDTRIRTNVAKFVPFLDSSLNCLAMEDYIASWGYVTWHVQYIVSTHWRHTTIVESLPEAGTPIAFLNMLKLG